MVESGLKKDLRAYIKVLREKAEEFEKKGDLGRAQRCRLLAKHLELFVEELKAKEKVEVKD